MSAEVHQLRRDERALPHNVELEGALLGGILVDNSAYFTCNTFLKPEHFSDPVLSEIYRVASSLIGEGNTASPITIKSYLPELDIGSMTVNELLASLAANATSVANVPYFAEQILELYLRSHLICLLKDTENGLYQPDSAVPVSKICNALYGDIAAIEGQTRKAGQSTGYSQILARAYENVRKSVSGEDKRIPWFLDEVQNVAGHMRAGNLIGVMSDSGGGKTSFSLQQCRHSAERGFKPAFFSIEITEEEAALQVAAQSLQVPMEAIDNLTMTDEQANRFNQEMGSDLPFRIIEFAECGLSEIRAQCLALKRHWGLDLVIIDHAKLINLPGKSNELFSERVNGLYRGLKAIAKELQIAVVILIQRNNEWKKRSSPRPMEGDAYGGGGVKQNLDIWFSIYRPDVFKEHMQQRAREAKKQEEKDKINQSILDGEGKAWIINHKRRRGQPQRSKPVAFKAQTVTFQSLPEHEPEFGL